MTDTARARRRQPLSPSAVARHVAAREAASAQAGAISRAQLRQMGWNDSMIASQLGARRWVRLLPGVYATSTGRPDMPLWWWAAHLHAGPDSHIACDSALQCWGLRPPDLPVLVSIPSGRKLTDPTGAIIAVRRRVWRPSKCPPGLPQCATVEDAVLDATDSMNSLRDITALVTQSCQRGRTSPDKLERVIRGRSRLRHRRVLTELLGEARDGATSVLEVDGVRRVLKAHGLPVGRGQARETAGGRLVMRDRLIDPFDLVIEFDGRLGHADSRSRMRDHRRDNAVIVSGRPVLRFGWEDVHEDACESAMQVATVLARLGWTGFPEPCGPGCRLVRGLCP